MYSFIKEYVKTYYSFVLKLLGALLCALVLIFLAGCGGSDADSPDGSAMTNREFAQIGWDLLTPFERADACNVYFTKEKETIVNDFVEAGKGSKGQIEAMYEIMNQECG